MIKSLRRLFKHKHRQTRHGERVPLEMLLNFRRAEQTDWCQGVAANISSGGVLFRADQAMDVHTPIQMSYSLPASIAGRAGLEVGCKGEVVRVETPDSNDGAYLFAVKILDYDSATR
ncbi:MAG TPA: PilZ domain-containing protein [Terriglobia bacterium]|nr:PilZ domain-containing protein [Terriglobia bacterium]